MKNIKLFKLFLVGMGLLLTSLTTQMWADEGFESDKNGIKYHKNSDANDTEWSFNGQSAQTRDLSTVTSLYLKEWFTREYENWDGCKGNTKFQYNIHRTAVAAGAYTNIANNWSSWEGWQSGWQKMKFGNNAQNINLLSGLGSGKYTMSFKYNDPDLNNITSPTHSLKWTIGVPSVSSGAVTSDGSGSGTDGSPFLVADGSTLTLTATGSQASTDANSVLYVKWGSDSYAAASSTTKTLTPTTTKQSITVKLKYYNSADNLSGSETTLTIYYQSTVTPSLNWAASDPYTPTALVSGESVTLNVVRANSSANITYQYKIGSGSWTNIATTSAQTYTYTVPEAHGATQTYYFRATMTDGSTYTTAASSAISVYGKKTIKVKNTNNWATMKLYLYSATAEKEAWPGSTTGITSAGGQWKTVVLTSEWPYFILNDNNNGNQIKGDKTYSYSSSVTDGSCYEISSGTGTSLTFSSGTCPSAPDVTTAAAGSFTNAKATLNASGVAANNDDITAYGFKWGTTTACTNTQAASNLSNTTFSYQLTGLTAGTTYYFKAYATNGQGTTEGDRLSFVVPYKVTVSTNTGCSSITNSGTNYTSSSITVVATKATGYTFSSWSTTNGTQTSTSSTSTTNTLTFTPTSDNATITPVYTENAYNATVSAGANGDVSPKGTVSIKQVTGTELTATPIVGYRFNNWTISGGGITPTSSSTNPQTFKATTTGGTIQANFARSYAFVEGRFHVTNAARDGSWTNTFTLGDWTSTNTIQIPFEYDDINHRFYRHTYATPKELTTNISDKAPYFYVTTSSASGSISNAVNFHPSSNLDLTTTGSANKKAAQTATANYNYKFNSNDESGYVVLYFDEAGVWYELEQSLKYNANGGTGSAPATAYYLKGTSATAAAANTFTRTGYTFNGWKTGKTSGTSYAAGANVPMNSNITLYAQWNANNYTITLDKQSGATGYGGGGTVTNPTVTYDGDLPALSGTMPSGTGTYGFMGFYSKAGGAGTKFIDAEGRWAVTDVPDTISNGKWVYDGAITLYAYYKKAEITAITFDAVAFESLGTVSFMVAVEPTPVAPTKLCFTVLHGNDNPLESQPTITYNSGTGKYSFTAPEASGTYKVQAVLRTGSSCDGGTELDTEEASFQVAGIHNVTVQYKCGDETIKSSSSVTGKPLEWTEVVAHKIVGYSFSSWTEGDGITLRDTTAARLAELQAADPTVVAVKRMKAIYDGKLTINYTPKRMIYFYNTLNWSNVYVYFYKNDSYWGSSNQGSGANTSWQLTNYPYGEGKHGKMSPVEPDSKIYYFDADSAGVNASYTNVVFTELNQHGCDYFYNNNKVVRRGDYNATTMPLFVPLSDQPAVDKNGKTAKYYCEGYWMNYPANTGYTLRIYDTWNADNVTGASREFLIPFSEDVKMPLKQEVEINFSGKSWFLIYRNDGKYLEGSHTFKQTDHGDKKITKAANAGSAKKMILLSDGSGIYTFNLSFRGDGGSPENYDYYLSVDFPAAVGDYRIVYKDNATWSNGAHGASWYHPSDIISKNKSETEAKEDIVSFFVSHGSSPSMKFQYISAINGSTGAITWTDVPSGSITIPASITKSGVYNFIVSQPAGGASISLEKAEPYTGNYYIRTDCAGETKWNNFRSPDHLMSYSEYSITHGGYSHYYTHWVQTTDKKNIQFCIANDYSSAISDTLIRESNTVSGWENINTYINSVGDILSNANVRFMWNQSTNKVSRAYVDGAQGVGSNNFLYILSEDSKIRNADESSLVNNKVQFSDKENWIYEAYIQAKPNAAIKLLSNWGESNKITQYFKGSSSSTEKLIGGSGSDFNTIRVLYDFKTNRLIAALVPTSGNYESDNAIEADIMFIREHQGDVAQLTFGENGKISKIETAYGVMRFNKWTMNNKSKEEGHSPLESPASVYERSLFWISFPFKVKLSEVFGFGTYGEHWAVQRYDGADRAARGHFQENGSFWKWMNRSTEYLEPNQGYLLAIDADLLTEDGGMWPNNIQNLELFFPSYGKMPDITNADVAQTIPSHECTINWYESGKVPGPDTKDPRTSYNRTIFDSHWNVISVPTYVNTSSVTFANNTWTTKKGPRFLYTWNADDNTITATTASGYTYHAMHAYMTQYAGDIKWSAASGSPSSIIARRMYDEAPQEVEFRLELQQNEQMIDQTFVMMSADEEVSVGFNFGEDLTKEFNANKSSIYTFIPEVAIVAGNTLPISEQTTIVPVGVDAVADGDYTFSMPNGTSGVGVTLIDGVTGERTNLALTDYTVSLEKGTYDQRFVLEISPIEHTTTAIENSEKTDAPNNVCKKLIDGVLYIIKDGKVFDARGARLQ